MGRVPVSKIFAALAKQCRLLASFGETTAHKARHPMAAFIEAALGSLHAAIIALAVPEPGRGSVVGHEDQDRIVIHIQLFQLGHQPAQIIIDIGYHAVECGMPE